MGSGRSSRTGSHYWANPGWIPEEIGVYLERGGVRCMEGEVLNGYRNYPGLLVYELVGVVADVISRPGHRSHLVSLINGKRSMVAFCIRWLMPSTVAISERTLQHQSQWHIFNDFMVREVEKEEALRFAPSWKTPIILTYQVKRTRPQVDDSWRNAIDARSLYLKGSLK